MRFPRIFSINRFSDEDKGGLFGQRVGAELLAPWTVSPRWRQQMLQPRLSTIIQAQSQSRFPPTGGLNASLVKATLMTDSRDSTIYTGGGDSLARIITLKDKDAEADTATEAADVVTSVTATVCPLYLLFRSSGDVV